MHPLLPLTNQVFGFLTISGQAILISLAVLTVITKRKDWPNWFEWMAQRGLIWAGVVAVIAMGGSLWYSDVMLLEPCLLCWYQRIAMYPQVLLLGLAAWRKEAAIVPYSMALAGVGAAIAVYHYLLQLGVDVNAPCAAVGYSVSCSDRFVLIHGYITIPLMALTAFLMIIAFLRLYWVSQKNTR